jgi:hypothetical protein
MCCDSECLSPSIPRVQNATEPQMTEITWQRYRMAGSQSILSAIILIPITVIVTYDHRTLKTRLPVRSALFKQRTGGLVVRWVTTSEYPLLYVFCILAALCASRCARRWVVEWGDMAGLCGCEMSLVFLRRSFLLGIRLCRPARSSEGPDTF